VAGAFLCALVFLVVLQLNWAPTGEDILTKVFSNPFVGGVATLFAGAPALVAFPFAYFCLRQRNLVTCSIFVFSVVLLEIAAATKLGDWLGFFGSFPALLVALLICRFSGLRVFRLE